MLVSTTFRSGKLKNKKVKLDMSLWPLLIHFFAVKLIVWAFEELCAKLMGVAAEEALMVCIKTICVYLLHIISQKCLLISCNSTQRHQK